ncbi:MAG: hypothetical protein J7K26_03585 [Candidatus Aenigmarchaeota archaeon]|nr:hypothetical protein [Candidatus Aenigmarchaeota archaeon]
MKVEIRKKGERTAILISFNTCTEKFDSNAERIKFFKELHGWKQIIVKNRKRYIYHRPGILSELPHIDVDKSVFIIMQDHLRKIEEFFKEWEEKVEFKMFPVLLNQEQFKKLREVE